MLPDSSHWETGYLVVTGISVSSAFNKYSIFSKDSISVNDTGTIRDSYSKTKQTNLRINFGTQPKIF